MKNQSSGKSFSVWLDGASNGAIYAKMDKILDLFGSDNSMNAACRQFLKLCNKELQVREDFGVLAACRRMAGGEE